MPDVFISYSRKDKDFVLRLHDALTRLQRDIWVDWEDIPLTADWWQEIRGGIEASDNFIFVITPSSLSSPVAMMEVAHAIDNSKRLIPIVRQMTDEKVAFEQLSQRPLDDNGREALNGRDINELAHANWQVLSRHNWLIFDQDDAFDSNLQRLLNAIDTDLEYARMHTRLLVQAHEWESSGKNRSSLLRGDNLHAAEMWLQSSVGKKPETTPLHSEYIFASRQNAIQAQRTFISRLFIGFIIALIFAVLALIFGFDAQRQRGIAEENASTAVAAEAEAEQNLFQAHNTQSLFLASLSMQQVHDGSPQDALLLARESLKFRPQIYHAESTEALINAMLAPIQEIGYIQHSTTISDAAWNPAGDAMYAWSPDGAIYLWQVNARDWRILNHPGGLNGVAWDHSGTRLLSWAEDGSVRWWDSTGTELHQIQHQDFVSGAAWSPDDSRILSWSFDHSLQIHDAVTGDLLLTMQHDNAVIGALWNKDGTKLLSWSLDQTARVWDAATGAVLFTLAHDEPVAGALWNTSESFIATWTADHLRVWHAGTGRKVHEYEDNNGIVSVQWSPDGNRVIAQANDSVLHLWEIRRSQDLVHDSLVRSAAWSNDSTSILTTSDDLTARVWSAADGSLLLTLPHDSQISGAFWNEDDSRILTYNGSSAHIWDARTGAELRTLRHEDSLRGAGWTRDGTRVLTWSWDKTMRLWDGTLGTELNRLRNDAVNLVALNADETRLLTVADDHSIRIWSAVDYPTLPAFDDTNAVWSPSQPWLLLWIAGDTSLHIWDDTTGQDLYVLDQPEGVEDARWNADGSQILITTFDGQIIVRDAASGDVVNTFAPEGGLSGIVWNNAGTRAITWQSGNTCQIWDAATGQPGASTTLTGEVGGGEWSEDGSHVLLWNKDNDLWVWDTTAASAAVPFNFENSFSSAWLTADGTKLISFENNSVANVRDTTSGEILQTLSMDSISSIEWSLDGTRTALIYPNLIEIWDTQSWTQLATLRHDDHVTGVHWNQAGTRLLSWSQDRSVRVWDAATGQELLRLGHGDWVAGAAWNQSETQILSWGYDRKIRLWDAETGQELLRLPNSDTVYTASWNFDETRLVSRSDVIRVWYTDLDDYLALGQKLLIRKLTAQDRRRFFLPEEVDLSDLTPVPYGDQPETTAQPLPAETNETELTATATP